MTLGQRIQELRKQKGMSQEGLGEALGVSRQAVSKWEGDNGIPELDTLIAMSRLFGITIGALLGVETEAPPAAEPRDGEEEKLEAILHRYVEEARAGQTPSRKLRWEWLAAAAAAVVLLMIVLFVQIGSLRSTVRLLRGEVSSLQVQVSNNLSGLSGQIRNSIYAILEEQAELLNTFSWELIDADLEAQTATVRLRATMKAYTAGSEVQFLTSWVKVDETQGETVSDWAGGPDFEAEMTLPLNYRTEVSIRVRDPEGNLQEQSVEEIHELHPEAFHLEAYNLLMPFAITVKNGGVTQATTKGEQAYVEIISAYPEVFWPEEAEIAAAVNGETVLSETMTITPAMNDHGSFCAAIEGNYFDLTLREKDQLEISVKVTDNLGRTEVFTHGGTVEDGWLEELPMTAPGVWAD